MSKFKAYIKDGAYAEIKANLVDPAKVSALDWVRIVYISKDHFREIYEVKIPKERSIPLSLFKKGCTSEFILRYRIEEITLDNSGQLIIDIMDEEDDKV